MKKKGGTQNKVRSIKNLDALNLVGDVKNVEIL